MKSILRVRVATFDGLVMAAKVVHSRWLLAVGQDIHLQAFEPEIHSIFHSESAGTVTEIQWVELPNGNLSPSYKISVDFRKASECTTEAIASWLVDAKWKVVFAEPRKD